MSDKDDAIHLMIAEHGAWRVLRVAIWVVLRGRERAVVDLDQLPEHLRRDIGLPPQMMRPQGPRLPIRL